MPNKRKNKNKNKNKSLYCPPSIPRVPNAIQHGIVTGFDFMRNQSIIYNIPPEFESNENSNSNEDDPSDTNENSNYNIVSGSSINAIKMIKLNKN